MGRAILISENKVISSLYEVNLSAYVATQLIVKNNFSAGIEVLTLDSAIDAIIIFPSSKKTKTDRSEFLSFLKTSDLAIPLIIMGETSENLELSVNVSNRYDIQGLVRSMAKILQITAKEMFELEVPKYFPIPLNLFSEMVTTPCDVYSLSGDDSGPNYFVIIESGSSIDQKLDEYYTKNVEYLYVDAEQRLHFINNASSIIANELSRSDLSSKERVTVTAQSMGVVAEEIFESREVSNHMADVSKACIESIQKTITDVPKLKKLLMLLLGGESEYPYKHSVVATYIAGEIIDNISWGSAEQKSKLSFAFFFHDIFLVPIYKRYPDAINEEDLLFRDDVSDADKKIVLEHAALAGQVVSKFPRSPMGADMIITQHHGMANGQGFAINFKDDISPLSKIMIVAEEVTTYILMNSNESRVNVDKEKIKAVLDEKFKNHTYKKITAAFIKANL